MSDKEPIHYRHGRKSGSERGVKGGGHAPPPHIFLRLSAVLLHPWVGLWTSVRVRLSHRKARRTAPSAGCCPGPGAGGRAFDATTNTWSAAPHAKDYLPTAVGGPPQAVGPGRPSQRACLTDVPAPSNTTPPPPHREEAWAIARAHNRRSAEKAQEDNGSSVADKTIGAVLSQRVQREDNP